MSCIWDWDDEDPRRRLRHVAGPGASLSPVPASRACAEQWAYVTAGTGRAPGGEALREGSVYLHRPFDAPPVFEAGDEGLELVLLGPRRPPRVFEEPHPGPRVGHVEDCESYEDRHDRVDMREHMIAGALESEHSGIGLVVIAPGKRGYPQHTHTVEDERYVVLAGTGTAYLDDEEHPIARGSVVDTPSSLNPPVARAFGAGPEGLTYLCWGEREPGDLAWQRESGKIMIRGTRTIFRPERLGYWDGEPLE